MALSKIAAGALWSACLVSAQDAFLTPARATSYALQAGAPSGMGMEFVARSAELPGDTASGGWGTTTTLMSAAALGMAFAVSPKRTAARAAPSPSIGSTTQTVVSIGKAGSISGGDASLIVGRCETTGRAELQKVQATSAPTSTASTVKVAINGFGRIGRNVFRVWLQRGMRPFNLVALNIGSMTPEQAAHLLKYDTVLGTLENDVSVRDDMLIVDGHAIKLLSGRDPAALPWKQMDVEVVIESTGAFNSFEGGSKHVTAGAKKVVLTAPGKNCPTFVVGVNEEDYDPKDDTVISNASCTTNGMASVCKVLDDHFGVEYGMMTTTHSYTGDQRILDAGHKDLRRARAAAMNIVPTSTGAAQAVSKVLPQFEGKLGGMAFRVPVPNVSVVDLVVKVSKKTSKEEVNAALKAAADGPLKGIIHYETKPLVSSDFMGTPYSNSVDAALTMVMGEDLVKVILWYDNEFGYSNRVVDLTSIVIDKL